VICRWRRCRFALPLHPAVATTTQSTPTSRRPIVIEGLWRVSDRADRCRPGIRHRAPERSLRADARRSRPRYTPSPSPAGPAHVEWARRPPSSQPEYVVQASPFHQRQCDSRTGSGYHAAGAGRYVFRVDRFAKWKRNTTKRPNHMTAPMRA
jgi:hypothetical protein